MIHTRTSGGVAEILIDNPPVNALGHAVREAVRNAVLAASSDPGVRALVIRCSGVTFCAGADISEFDKPLLPPSLPEVIAAIEACPKPVIAAIHGNALGGGLELALACGFRIAAPGTRFGLPEVKLGLLPGAGGTQRLPRLVGVEAALSMIVEGVTVSAQDALRMGLIDKLLGSDADFAAQALSFAAEVAKLPLPTPVGARDGKLAEARADPSLFDRYRATHARALKGLEAPEACIRAVQAAVELPLAQGLELERSLFMQLAAGEQSHALRHLFFAERAARKIEGVTKETPTRPVRRVGVIGAGTMGTGIAMNFLSCGIPVTLVEQDQAALDRGVGMIRKNYESSARRGRFTTGQVEAALALLTPAVELDSLAECDLVIEAVFELMDAKQDIFRKLDSLVAPHAILASNTSYLDINAIASVTRRPENVLGMHFFSPANLMKLLEIVRGRETTPDVLKTAMDLARKIDKTAVVVGVCHGFVGNRILARRQEQATQLVAEGAQPWEVDQVLLDFGIPMGPFQMSDLAGLDLGWTRENSTGSTLREVLCEADRRGQKNGRGFYDYDENRRRTPSAEVTAIINAFRARKGVEVRTIGADEIRERLLYPMINEGALILEEGIAQRSSDIDLVWINGYGWPRQTGGPMFWAETVGIATVVEGLEKWADKLGDGFSIARSLKEKSNEGLRHV